MVIRQSIWHCMRAEAQGTTLASSLGRVGVAHAGEDSGQVHVLELRGPLAGELGIEVLPRTAEGLAPLGRFGLQALGVLAADLVEQPLVELVAVAGDFGQQLGSVTVESNVAGPSPLMPLAMRIVPASTAAGFEQQFVARECRRRRSAAASGRRA